MAGQRRAPESASDPDLVKGCLAGRQEAWDALLQRHGSLVFSVALRAGLSQEDAADVFQVVWTKLFESLGSLRDGQRVAAWLITTTSRESRAWQRKYHAVLAASAVTDGVASDVADGAELPEDAWLHLERQAIVRSVVGELNPPCRALIELLFTEGVAPTYAQLASRLGIPLNSLGPTRSRCLERLKRELGHRGFQN